jgi:PAS domain S-box-containing protein
MANDNGRAALPITAPEWRQIVNGAADTAIMSIDSAGRVTSWNEGAHNILGWTEAEMLGQQLDCIFTDEDQRADKLAKEIADARKNGRGGGAEGWRVRKDGSRFWATGEVTPIRNQDQIIGFTKILRDRTAQRRAEDMLAEERRVLEVLNRVSSALAVETDLQRLLQLVTDAGIALTRAQFGAFFHNPANDSGDSYQRNTLVGTPKEAFARFSMLRDTKIFAPTFNGESIIRSDDITKDPRHSHDAPLRDPSDGHQPVRSYLAVAVRSRSGQVIGGLFLGHEEPAVFTQDSERGLTNLAAEAAVAIDNARLSAATQREIAERKQAEEALRLLNADLERQVAQRTEELRRKDETLRQAQKMEAVGQLTGGVAHDFNNLLQIILGNLEALQRNLPPDSARTQRALAQAMNGAQRASALTQRLLAFSRRQPLDPRPIDVNALVSGMSELIHRVLGETVSVETVRGAGLWMTEADPNELESAILNLAVNARDAMRGGGHLTIETANAHIDSAYATIHAEVTPGQYVVISVSDTGIGMDAETVARAFEPFFTTKPVGQGTGLGLSQVYGFVKQSGGHVKIYSEVGQGTTVKIYLPHLARAHDEPAAEELPVPEGGKDETILVVEDDEGVRVASVDALRELGYRVMDVHDGPSALRLLEREPDVALLFTDVVLPGGMTGATLAAAVRERQPNMKVLFTTGYARNAIIHQGRLDKGVHLLTKPFTFAQLAAKVRDVLDDLERD